MGLARAGFRVQLLETARHFGPAMGWLTPSDYGPLPPPGDARLIRTIIDW